MTRYLSMLGSGSEWSRIQFVSFTLILFLLGSCGGTTSESLNPGDDLSDGSTIQRGVNNSGNESPVFDVDAGVLQVSDSNVLVRLNGQASIESGVEPAAILWEQTEGPKVTIINGEKLICDIVIPDFTEPTDLTFQLTVWNEQGVPNSASTTILVRPQNAFARVTGGVVNESDGSASFGVFLNAPSDQTIVISYTTIDGTAVANEDFIPVSGELVFAPGEIQKTVTVTLIDDSELEPAEEFSLRISTDLEEGSFAISGAIVIASEQDPQLEQQIRFLAGASATLDVGTTLDSGLDTTDAPGTGRLLVSSSNPGVATIDEAGFIEALAVGSTTMTALKEADETYKSASANIAITVVNNVVLREQDVAFEKPGAQQIFEDETLSNPLIVNDGVSTGINYASSNPNIATVSNVGVVIPAATGSVTITANVPGNDEFAPVSTSYQLTVLPRDTQPQQIRFVAGTSATMTIGSTLDGTLDTSAAPGSGTISFSNSNSAVAVLDNGLFVANAVGTTTITADKAADATYEAASTSITIEVIEDDVTLREQNIQFERSGAQQIFEDETLSNPIVIIEGVTEGIRYASSNADVATVDNNGLVTPVAPGNVTISVQVPGDNEFLPAQASYSLSVQARDPTKQTQAIRFVAGTAVTMTIGTSIDGSLDTSNAPGSGAITFGNSNSNVAVLEDGEIVANAVGTTTITADKAADDNYEAASASITVTVVEEQDDRRDQNIGFERPGPQEIFNGETLSNRLIVNEGVNDGIRYSSSDTNIASVDQAGLVSAVAPGNVTISAQVPGNDEFFPAQASYSLEVVARTITKQPQQIRFVSGSEASIIVGNTIDGSLDTSNAPGSGAITFNNSNPNVAVLEGSEIVANAAGTTTISASKAEDDNYEAASTSITITVVEQQDTRRAQDIGFEQPGPLEILIDDTLSNPLIVNEGVNEGIRYNSSNTNVATVDSNGLVTPVEIGNVTISASVPENNEFLPAEASYQLTVSAKVEPQPQRLRFVPADNVKVVRTGIEINVGESADVALDTSAAPGSGAITFEYSNSGVAEFNDGVITAIDNGTTTITATKAADTNYLAAQTSITVTVVNALATQDIAFEKPGPQTLFEDEFLNNPLVVNQGVTEGITYSSSDTNIATVNSVGEVVPAAPGVVTITANVPGNSEYLPASASYQLTVNERTVVQDQRLRFVPASNVRVVNGVVEIVVGGSANVALDTSAAPGSGEITFSYSNQGVAEFNDGVISAIDNGTTTITATKAADSNYNAATSSIQVSVVNALTEQDIAFEKPGPQTIFEDEFLNNPLVVNQGVTEGITYSSSDTNIATVNSVGEVVPAAPGVVTITANVPGNSEYLPASASYQLTINARAVVQDQRIRFVPSSDVKVVNGVIEIVVGGSANVALDTSAAPGSGEITFSYSNQSVAEFSDGVISAIDNGTTTITATKAADSNYNAATASIQVSVVNALTEQDIEFERPGPLDMFIDESLINRLIVNEGVTDGIRYSSSDSNIASVDNNGQVTPVETGSVTITANVPGNSEFLPAQASYRLTINEKIVLQDQRIRFEPAQDLSLIVGSTEDVALITSDAPGSGVITFTSSNPNVAQYDNGVVFGNSVGRATITATKAADDNYNAATATLNVTVIDKSEQDIQFERAGPLRVPVNESLSNPLVVNKGVPENTKYSSSNTNIATVDDSGVVTGISPGQVTITADVPGDSEFLPATARYQLTVFEVNAPKDQTISFVPGQDLTMTVGTTQTVQLDTSNAPGKGEITIETSSPNIAQYDAGVIYANSVGTATITATMAADDQYNAATATIKVTVIDKREQDIEFEQPGPLTTKLRGTFTNPIIINEGVQDGITYISSDPKIASVDNKGTVSAISEGNVTISVRVPGDTEYLPASASYQLTVVQ